MNKQIFGNRIGNFRWRICALLFFATTINYIDRQILGILAPQLQKQFDWTDSHYGFIVSSFQAAYAIGFLFMGYVIDKIGSRLGYVISIAFWSVATLLHALVRTAFGFGAVRFILGLGESGNFPAALKAVSEWFPIKERSFATGIFVSGASIGAIVAPLFVPMIVIHFGWQWSFIVTGLLGLIWIFFWLRIYRTPQKHSSLSKGELDYIMSDPVEQKVKVSWLQLLKYKQTWAFTIGKFMTDPIFSFFFFFLPKFFDSNYGVRLDKIGPPLMVIYLMSDLGSIAGGWVSSFLIKRGWSVNASRKTTMLIAALNVTPVYFAAQAHHLWTAVGLIGLAMAAHSAWSSNLFTLTTDMFPRQVVGSVVGIGSTVGAIGGMFGATFAGFLLQTTGSYLPLFIVAGSAYLIALGSIQLLVPRLKSISMKIN
jgi:ACS family hexuronate transporter-like MFS transporter